jgi:hypothetical protein
MEVIHLEENLRVDAADNKFAAQVSDVRAAIDTVHQSTSQ